MDQLNGERQIHPYDRLRGSLEDVALGTKPSTVQEIEPITGRAETFIVKTYRTEKGDYVFIEAMTQDGLTRLALPPKAANAIAAQRDALTTKRRRITGKRLAQERKDRGELPGFMRGKKNKSKEDSGAK